ncbi:AMP-binding protein [Desulfobacula toluolica]|uniref:Predicted 2,3-dihydroxybenzoate-AMP ligase, associated with genes of phenol catabolism n=1 Tax=Desulfobacula toluolica (strain DSM 7467 / Tol2) TaxID=651182 RepID=K0NF58_DESTT|nr:class I adenylate-forming enzyme family protein [Desulfobacula toluolica]CCK79761.1 predicted 2,3-dihydroxybenzoate-AMP ligase, associated with genes of phenol catabolism [Desulfobacula toluolica Tol2]
MKPIRYTKEMTDEFLEDGYWTRETFYDFWEKNAREIPDQEALVDSKYRLTWKQAVELVDAMAISWVEMGIEKHSRVIIQSPNSVYGFLARIACERAGLISLTVYPYLRKKELTYMVDRTKASAVIILANYNKFNYLEMYEDLQKDFPHLKNIFLFDDMVPQDAPKGTFSLTSMVEKRVLLPVDKSVLVKRRFDPVGNIAILTTTSGTTGIPKLVEWPPAPRICTSKGRVDIWNLTKDDITMAIAPHAGGAAGTLTYFAAPIAGAKTVMLEEFSPDAALALIEKEKATAIGVVPTHLIRMLEADVSKYDLSSLRFIRSAGGYLAPQVAEEAEKAFGASITSDLGTQDMGSVSGCRVEDSKDLRRRTVGRMLPGNKVRLADKENKEKTVPDGEPGILYFRGPHAPAGYYRDEELTSTVFDKDGWTTTEDIVKFDQGCLWILGRAKDMIIRGGQNIYPAEVEGLLNDHPAVASVAIVGYPDREMGEKCAAYVIPKKGEQFDFKTMVDYLKSKDIAMFKLPEHLEIVDEFPAVGDSGKVNKETLKKDIRKRLGLN